MKNSSAKVFEFKERRREITPATTRYVRVIPEDLYTPPHWENKKPKRKKWKTIAWSLLWLSMTFILISINDYLYRDRQWNATEKPSTLQISKSTTKPKSSHHKTNTEQ